MVTVTIKKKFDEVSFKFEDYYIASDFVNLALNAATEEIKVVVEKVVEPAEKPQEESRFIAPEEMTEVPQEELVNAEDLF